MIDYDTFYDSDTGYDRPIHKGDHTKAIKLIARLAPRWESFRLQYNYHLEGQFPILLLQKTPQLRELEILYELGGDEMKDEVIQVRMATSSRLPQS